MNIIDTFNSVVDLLNLLHHISNLTYEDKITPIVLIVGLNTNGMSNKLEQQKKEPF
ncbi:hypothetical protein [Priestia megaterium]|uniref:hypothetical protein n=1 Tax=Priestia megaterium TaxID=1404 RepID=UPI003D2B3909